MFPLANDLDRVMTQSTNPRTTKEALRELRSTPVHNNYCCGFQFHVQPMDSSTAFALYQKGSLNALDAACSPTKARITKICVFEAYSEGTLAMLLSLDKICHHTMKDA